ncbi:phosphate/phosphite/phosphonate ABC transporter substrate-binding protein [Cognatishimia sp. F0-27]|uniref:phosphate/phosphite/phosphonate ABC transporter substrate-binding protein n=1 Tax=Cognatishimia sp. F0-27 TaxID=2816855 RepID=UPI001D0C64DF
MLERTIKSICSFFMVIWCVPALAGDGTAEDPLVFGIVPARSPERVLSDFGPLVEAMERDLGVVARIRGAPDYETFIRRVFEGDAYDLILTGGDIVQFIRERDLYRPIVQMDGPGIFAVIAVDSRSSYYELEDLRGRARVATADLLAYSTGLGFRRLAEAGIDPSTDIEVVYVPSQSAALATIVRGQVDASIIMSPIVRSAPRQMRDSIRIIAETERAPPPAISVSTGMDSDLADRILQFFIEFMDREESVDVFQSMGWPGLAPVRLDKYDALDWAAESMADRLRALEN